MTLEKKTSIRSLARFRSSPSRRSVSGRARNEDDVHARAVELSSGEKWNELRALLEQDGEAFTSSSNSSLASSPPDATGETALHAACWNHPPVDVVRMLAAAYPPGTAVLLRVDSDGRTPLHVAAARGASPRVISCLLELDGGSGAEAASMRDAAGKTPIVLCCEKCCHDDACDPGNYEVERKLVDGPLIEVVRALCEACPDAVNVPDDEDMTALEYAILMGATREVVKTLQKVSVKAWKANAKSKLEMGTGGNGSSTSLQVSKSPSSGRNESSSASQLPERKSKAPPPREGRRDSTGIGRYSFEKQRSSFKDLLKLRSPSMTAPRSRNGGDEQQQSRQLSLRKKSSMPRAA